MIEAIRIDATEKSIANIPLPEGDLFPWLREQLSCEWVEPIRLGRAITLWIDEEGLLAEHPGPFFQVEISPGRQTIPISKFGVILAAKEDETLIPLSEASPNLSMKFVHSRVRFPSVRFVGFVQSQKEEDHPLFGRVTVIRREAQFEELN